MKEIVNKLNFIKIKNLCSVKDNVKKMNRQAIDKEQHLEHTYLIRNYSK